MTWYLCSVNFVTANLDKIADAAVSVHEVWNGTFQTDIVHDIIYCQK
ncbi:MAG TPA: hypothetical protein HA258_06695 [Thermoplasmata archaeon]|nr:hypothetical protein [Thermoplasmata archaeon]